MPLTVFTIGHSNHAPDRFLALLAQHEVEALVDIRRFPGSRKHPHFHRDNLAAALQKADEDNPPSGDGGSPDFFLEWVIHRLAPSSCT